MWTPQPNQVQTEFQKIIDEQGELVTLLEENARLSSKEFIGKKDSLVLAINNFWKQIPEPILQHYYPNIHDDMMKLLKIIYTDNSLEIKYLGKNNFGNIKIDNWELEYRNGKYRKDLIKFHKKIQAEMIKISKKIV